MSDQPLRFSDLSADSQELLAIYRNLRRGLVTITAAGPLMERRDKFSKLEDGERRGYEESTQIREQIRLLFKLRDILIQEGVPLDIEIPRSQVRARAAIFPRSKTLGAKAQTAAAAASMPDTPLDPLGAAAPSGAFNPGMKFPRPPAQPAYANSLSSTMSSPGRTIPVFKTSA